MELDVKKLVEKTKEDEATYKRVAEERKQLEEKVALLQVSEGLSEENRQELKPVQFRLSQPAFYTNPDKMKDLIKQVEELIRKVEEVEKQYAMESGSPISTPLARQPSDGCMIANLHGSMSDPNVFAPEFGMDSPPSVHKTPTDGDVYSRREVELSQSNPVKVQGQQALFSQGATSPIAGVQVSLRQSFLNSSSNGNMGAQHKKTNREPSLIYQSPKTKDDGNENQC